MNRTLAVLVLAAIANVLGWVLPVIDRYHGWQAFRVGMSPLWPFERFEFDETYLVILSVSSALTNALFVAAALLLINASAARARVCLWLAAAATLLNLHWTITMEESAADLLAGYYLWVVSFALLALAAFLRIHSLRSAQPH